MLTGVGAPLSSSALTVEGLLRLLLAGLVLALGPLELVPCWLCWSCMLGACMCPCAGLPIWGELGSCRCEAAGEAPKGKWLKLGVRWFGGILFPEGCPFMVAGCGAFVMLAFTYCSRAW